MSAGVPPVPEAAAVSRGEAASPVFGKILIFGVGLIGGSFALALKAAADVAEVVGFGRSADSLNEALALGIIDRIGTDPALEVGDADLVLVAAPVGATGDILARIAPGLGPRTIVTDAGSTKSDVVAAARAALGERIGQFVPAHPIAGAENSGAAAARVELYRGRKVVVTPLAENPAAAVDRVRAAWVACGAEVRELSPQRHDEVFAAVSHLPHLLSFALVHDLALRDERDTFFTYAASGFRDFTRIAASHPEMWRDICLANREALLVELDRYRAELDDLRVALASGDGERLQQVFAVARSARRAWQQS